jgi:hypothetical protein
MRFGDKVIVIRPYYGWVEYAKKGIVGQGKLTTDDD